MADFVSLCQQISKDDRLRERKSNSPEMQEFFLAGGKWLEAFGKLEIKKRKRQNLQVVVSAIKRVVERMKNREIVENSSKEIIRVFSILLHFRNPREFRRESVSAFFMLMKFYEGNDQLFSKLEPLVFNWTLCENQEDVVNWNKKEVNEWLSSIKSLEVKDGQVEDIGVLMDELKEITSVISNLVKSESPLLKLFWKLYQRMVLDVLCSNGKLVVVFPEVKADPIRELLSVVLLRPEAFISVVEWGSGNVFLAATFRSEVVDQEMLQLFMERLRPKDLLVTRLPLEFVLGSLRTLLTIQATRPVMADDSLWLMSEMYLRQLIEGGVYLVEIGDLLVHWEDQALGLGLLLGALLNASTVQQPLWDLLRKECTESPEFCQRLSRFTAFYASTLAKWGELFNSETLNVSENLAPYAQRMMRWDLKIDSLIDGWSQDSQSYFRAHEDFFIPEKAKDTPLLSIAKTEDSENFLSLIFCLDYKPTNEMAQKAMFSVGGNFVRTLVGIASAMPFWTDVRWSTLFDRMFEWLKAYLENEEVALSVRLQAFDYIGRLVLSTSNHPPTVIDWWYEKLLSLNESPTEELQELSIGYQRKSVMHGLPGCAQLHKSLIQHLDSVGQSDDDLPALLLEISAPIESYSKLDPALRLEGLLLRLLSDIAEGNEENKNQIAEMLLGLLTFEERSVIALDSCLCLLSKDLGKEGESILNALLDLLERTDFQSQENYHMVSSLACRLVTQLGSSDSLSRILKMGESWKSEELQHQLLVLSLNFRRFPTVLEKTDSLPSRVVFRTTSGNLITVSDDTAAFDLQTGRYFWKYEPVYEVDENETERVVRNTGDLPKTIDEAEYATQKNACDDINERMGFVFGDESEMKRNNPAGFGQALGLDGESEKLSDEPIGLLRRETGIDSKRTAFMSSWGFLEPIMNNDLRVPVFLESQFESVCSCDTIHVGLSRSKQIPTDFSTFAKGLGIRDSTNDITYRDLLVKVIFHDDGMTADETYERFGSLVQVVWREGITFPEFAESFCKEGRIRIEIEKCEENGAFLVISYVCKGLKHSESCYSKVKVGAKALPLYVLSRIWFLFYTVNPKGNTISRILFNGAKEVRTAANSLFCDRATAFACEKCLLDNM